MRVLLIGGSKSGKSMLAQKLASPLSKNSTAYYWAAMEPTDGEDEERILRHRRERDGWGFVTIEKGRALTEAADELDAEGTILFDSLTALMANEMFADGFEPAAEQIAEKELKELSLKVRNFVLVCDDIFRDGCEYDSYTEHYRKAMAKVCRALAKDFDTVYEVVSGIPKLWKGENNERLD